MLIVLAGWTVVSTADEIGTMAASPYHLARFINAHPKLKWEPLWRALRIQDEGIFLPSCEQDLNGVASVWTELITVVDPLQIIVLLEHRSSHFQVFLRYESAARDKWRFSGAYAPFVKYSSPRPPHRTTRTSTDSSSSLVKEMRARGSSSREESWIDLTREDLTPPLALL